MLRAVALLALAFPTPAGADLAVSGVSASRNGASVRVTDTVRNLGTRRAPRSRVEYRLVRPGGGTRVRATRAVAPLAPGHASRGTVRLTGVDGSARVLACVEDERDERNNCGATLPAPRIGAQPADPTAATDARFTFSHSWRGVRFDCRLDDGTPGRCASPVSYTELAEGDHRFSVTAWRGARRLSATTIYRWTVDTTAPPALTVSSGPDAVSNRRDAEFRFADRDAEATFRCVLDGAPAEPCTSPQRYAGPLADGEHTFAVEARDPAGNASAARTITWAIDATAPPAPSIDEAPEATSPATTTRFAFSDAEPGVRFSCRLDDSAAVPCSSPVEYADLTEGEHRFTVVARDAAGNAGTAAREWTVRLRPGAATGPAVAVRPTLTIRGPTTSPQLPPGSPGSPEPTN